MAVDRDRLHEANEAIDRRARQRDAAARALQELTPEAIALEEERQRKYAGGVEEHEAELLPGVPETAVQAAQEAGGRTLDEKLAAAVEEALEEQEGEIAPQPEIVGIGRSVLQWILVPSEEDEDGYQLALQLQVDEQPPAGFAVDITPTMLEGWARGKGLQGNRIEHKQFVAALFERAIAVGASETGNQLIYTLEQLMGTWVAGHWVPPYNPTETAVGGGEVVPFLSLDEYVAVRDAYSEVLTPGEWDAFLASNHEWEEQIERQSAVEGDA